MALPEKDRASEGGSRRWWLISAALTAAVLVGLASFVDLGEVAGRLSAADPAALGMALGLMLLSRFVIDTLRWRWVLAGLGCGLGAGEALLLQASSIPLRLVTPAKSGVIASALYLRRRHALPVTRALSSVFLEKAHNLMAYVGLVALLPLAGAVSGDWALTVPTAWLVAGSAAVVLGASVGWALRSRILALLGPKAAKLTQLVSAFWEIGPAQQAGLFGLTALGMGVEFVEFQLLFQCVGADIPLAALTYGLTVAILISNLPLTLGGVGTREAAALALFAPMADPEAVLAAMALLYAGHILLPALVGALTLPLFFSRLGRS